VHVDSSDHDLGDQPYCDGGDEGIHEYQFLARITRKSRAAPANHEGPMHDILLSRYVKFQNLMSGEQGQDLVEYGLLCTLIALVMISSISPIATVVTHFFTNVSTSLA